MNSPSSSELSSDLDLTSVGSLSSPPIYPSPPPSQGDSSSQDAQNPHKRALEDRDAPPAKKRRKVEPKPRTTQHLDLRSPLTTITANQKGQLDLLLKVLRRRQKIVVIAGAGISVSAGSMYCKITQTPVDPRANFVAVPDFRSATGLFAALRTEHKLKASGKHLFDASVYQTDDSTSSFHDMVRELSEKAAAASPTEFHHLLAKLASDGRLMRLYTQNVDGLDTSLPPLGTTCPLSGKGPWPRTVQLHGGLQKMACSKCNHISDFEPALFRGSTPPPCTVCIEADKVRTDHAGKRSHGVGKLRPRMVLYNEFNPDEEAIGTVMKADLRARPDAVIVVGTSMKIPGVRRIVREMCGVVRGRRDGVAIWINHEPPPVGKEFEDCWDLTVVGDSDKVAAHANLRRWDDDSVDYKECSESDSERARANDSKVKVIIDPPMERPKEPGLGMQVIVPTPVKKTVASALLTPAASPRPKSVVAPVQLKMFPQLKVKGGKEGERAAKLSEGKVPAKTSAKASRSKTKMTKSATAKRNSHKSVAASSRINTAFKVSKPQQRLKQSKPPATDPKPPEVVLSKDDGPEHSQPMAPISPSAARNNGPLLPQVVNVPSKQCSRVPVPQENKPIHIPVEHVEVFEGCKLQTPTKHEDVISRSPSVRSSPHFVTTQNSPSRPSYERLLSPTFVTVQNSPSRPCYERFVLPGEPGYTKRYAYPEASTEDSAQDAENAATGPARLLFPSGHRHQGKHSERPLLSELVTDMAAQAEKPYGGGRLKRMSEEIISPTTIPNSMKDLLN